MKTPRIAPLVTACAHASGVTLTDQDIARVEAADEAALERYLERFVTADSVAAVLAG